MSDTCRICGKLVNKNRVENLSYCQGHSRPEIIRHNKARFD